MDPSGCSWRWGGAPSTRKRHNASVTAWPRKRTPRAGPGARPARPWKPRSSPRNSPPCAAPAGTGACCAGGATPTRRRPEANMVERVLSRAPPVRLLYGYVTDTTPLPQDRGGLYERHRARARLAPAAEGRRPGAYDHLGEGGDQSAL